MTLWAGGRALVGGSPWRVSTLAPVVQDLALRLRSCGAAGISLRSPRDRAVLRVLLDRGFAECAPGSPATVTLADVEIVIPVHDDADRLRDLLATLPATVPADRVLVVDDASTDPTATEHVVTAAGARLVRHEVNRGPAAARNTGLQHTAAPFVAFIDADCLADDSWPTELLRHFDDPAVAAVAPRVTPKETGTSVLGRYEATRSSLDMGAQPELVRPGARLGFVPSAAIVVRRSAVEPGGFDEDLRLGEDVDLAWRLNAAGWLIRYDPTVTVRHHSRTRLRSWLRRKFDYGTSAADLEARHPGNLAPARLSPWSLTTMALLGSGHPLAASAVQAVPVLTLARRFRSFPSGSLLAGRVAAQGLMADVVGVGQALRREWWPIGAMAVAASPWSRTARLGATAMIAPLLLEWLDRRPATDPLSYVTLRVVDDAAYGSGVIASSARARSAAPLVPHISVPEGLVAALRRRRDEMTR